MTKIPDDLQKAYMDQLAKDLTSVQPMPNDTLKLLYENAKDKETLKKEGYEPVSSLGLMWIKKDKS